MKSFQIVVLLWKMDVKQQKNKLKSKIIKIHLVKVKIIKTITKWVVII